MGWALILSKKQYFAPITLYPILYPTAVLCHTGHYYNSQNSEMEMTIVDSLSSVAWMAPSGTMKVSLSYGASFPVSTNSSSLHHVTNACSILSNKLFHQVLVGG